MYVERNIEARSCNHCCSGKAISITYSECVSVASGIQQAKRLHLITLSPVACLAPPYFSTLFHKRNGFWEKGMLFEHDMRVILRRTQILS